jgi:hypothetical protein
MMQFMREFGKTLMEFLVFQTGNFGQKIQIGGGGLGKKTPSHFGQVDFNMFGVIGVVFSSSKIRTI